MKQYIKENYQRKTITEMADELGAHYNSVRLICINNGWKPLKESLKVSAAKQFIKDNCHFMTRTQLSKATGMDRNWVVNYCGMNKIHPVKENARRGVRKEFKEVRPVEEIKQATIYSNLPSPYGIADELHRKTA